MTKKKLTQSEKLDKFRLQVEKRQAKAEGLKNVLGHVNNFLGNLNKLSDFALNASLAGLSFWTFGTYEETIPKEIKTVTTVGTNPLLPLPIYSTTIQVIPEHKVRRLKSVPEMVGAGLYGVLALKLATSPAGTVPVSQTVGCAMLGALGVSAVTPDISKNVVNELTKHVPLVTVGEDAYGKWLRDTFGTTLFATPQDIINANR